MTDPYSVLGITPSADDETIKKAYRKKCKEYHPDLHPDDPSAEEHFKEVQAAYSEIMRIKQGGGASYSAGGQRYGSSQSGYSQQYQDPFSGAGFGFGPFGFGYYSTSGSSGRQSYGSAAGDPELRAAANYIRSGFYEEAMNTLNGIPTANRTAQWHYYAALANQGLGNNIRAQEEARTAVSMEPNNYAYQNLLDQLQSPGRYYGGRMLRFTAVGYELPRTKAVELELDGEWVESKYGYQLQVEQWQEIVPQTADGLLAYLGSGLIKGIGPKTAEDIVATFGPDTLNILDNEPEKLLQIRGITEGKLKDIEESYAESRVLRNLMSLLGPFKITPATALKIYQNFGPACVDILKKCPYDLCQISGFGFKRVDGIVRKTDNRLHSAERIKGAVLYTLEDARSKSGHLFLPSEDLVKKTLLLLNAPIPIPEQRVRAEEVQETLQQMILHGAVVAYKQYLYSPRVFGQEDDTARMIAERLVNISVAENIESALESVRESLGITLSQKQEQAVRTAFQHGLTIITGSPGTGKTTVLKAIIEVFKNLHPKGKFALLAPTGRASRRMAESTGVDEARTLHSALGLGTGEEVGDGERVRFVDADLVIVDEFSMVDMWLAQQFFKRIGQHTRVVLVGDPNQLPSVGAGNVFYELIHSGMVPVTVLDWIFRQSKDGLIAYNAKFINEGSTKLYYGNDFVFVDTPTQIETARRIQDIYCKEAAERGIENVQILSPFREKGEAASEQLNRAIRERVNPFRSVEEEVKIGSRTFRVHDRVMQTKNTEKVSNGDLGFITGITTGSKGERLVQMDFGGERKIDYTLEQLSYIDLAYATTIHKSMGSEYETVIIPIVKAHTIMLYRNLLYTAVTRAKKKVILVGHKPILFMAVHRADISKRNTMLGERIRLYCKAYHTERNALPELQQAG